MVHQNRSKISYKLSPSKIFWKYIIKIFTGFRRYGKILFGARFWGAVCAPKRHICGFCVWGRKWPFWAILAEISVCATWVHPTPKFFGPHQVMTPDYFPNKYFSSTPKTREDMLFQSLPFLNVDFWCRKVHNSIKMTKNAVNVATDTFSVETKLESKIICDLKS